jgi:hypothetical protein
VSAPSVPLVRAWLVTRFRDAVAVPFPELTVTYGDPGGVAALKYAWVAVVNSVEPGVTRGLSKVPDRDVNRDETYVLRTVIWVPSPGDYSAEAQQAVTELTWEIAGVLDAALRDSDPQVQTNRTAGGLVQHLYVSRFADTDYLTDDGRASQIVLDITVRHGRS